VYLYVAYFYFYFVKYDIFQQSQMMFMSLQQTTKKDIITKNYTIYLYFIVQCYIQKSFYFIQEF